MIRNRYILKGCTWFLIFIMTSTLFPQQAYALTGGPSQPEVQSFAPIGVTDMVDPATGDFSYNIPLLEVGGYPINLAYNAGITMDDEASTVGLGWNINPGVIHRNVRGIPDDFSGDEVASQTNIKPNITVGVSGTIDFELFGKELAKDKNKFNTLKSLKPTLGIEYNNYEGMNLSFGISPSFKIGKILGDNRTMNLGSFGASTKNGNSFDKPKSFIKKTDTEEKKEQTYTIKGAKKLLFRLQNSTVVKGLDKIDKKEIGDFFKKSYPDYFPTIKNEFENYAFTANFMIPAEFFGAAAGIRLPGYYVEQKLKAKTSISSAYGTLYSEDGKNKKQALHDFNREKDIPFTKDVPNLPLTQRTFDVYSVAGQGISGSYKLKRGDVGLIYDNQASNMSAGGSVGFEIGGSPNLLRLGGDFHGNYGTTKTGPWSENFDVFDKLNFQKGENNNINYEPAYFKSSGELSVTDRNVEKYYNNAMRSQAVSVKLDNNKNVKPESEFNQENQSISQRLMRTAREKRNQSISYLTAKEAVHQGLNKKIQSYPKNSGLDKNVLPQNIERTDTKRKDHHIGEITAVRPDGLRYVYGIPAYNNVQHEVSFNVSGNGISPTCQDGTIAYNSSDNSLNNKNGTDHYYNKTTTPAHAHSYLLTAILSDDYSDLSGDGPSPDDLGSYTKINYTRVASSYKWRVPYLNANHNKGFLSDNTDDKASYQYGEKEYWIIHSIESKTQVAEFYYNTKGRRDARGVVSESGGRGNDQKMEQLEKIVLYSRPDKYKDNLNGLEPIKSVHFEYDYSLCKTVPTTDNRITKAFSSLDGLLWNEDARYFYYLHGPLARVEYGDDKVQGLDYLYTMQGWIKGGNVHGENVYQNEPGADGNSVGINKFIGRDAMAFTLGYFQNDYNSIGNLDLGYDQSWINFGSDLLPSLGQKGLYNGNIATMITDLKTQQDGISGYAYQYDQLHRIMQAKNYAYPIENSNQSYNTFYSYNPDGNLLSLQRYGDNGLLMDNLAYSYNATGHPNNLQPNTLKEVSDTEPVNDFEGDFDGTQQYIYDKIGNLIENSEASTTIDWDVYNKVNFVNTYKELENGWKSSSTQYGYDAFGNRVSKHFYQVIFTGNPITPVPDNTYYIRDLNGNVLATYDWQGNQKEIFLYGSSRIGSYKVNRIFSFDEASKFPTSTHYELTNHLGNVLTTVTGRKLGIDEDNDDIVDFYQPEVVQASDYYPFGSEMPGRTYKNPLFLGTNEYRFGFNGKELDKSGEWGSLSHYDYGFRIYNPSIGKFLSVDPLTKSYPMLTPYQFASNSPIANVDLDGLESAFAHPVWQTIFHQMEKNNETVYGRTLGDWEHRSTDHEKKVLLVTFSFDVALTYGLAYATVGDLFATSPNTSLKQLSKPKIRITNTNVGNRATYEFISGLLPKLEVRSEANVLNRFDIDRGAMGKIRETEAFVMWNKTLGDVFGSLRRIEKSDVNKYGDGIFDTGILKGKTVDHVGPEIGKPYEIEKVINSIKEHYLKSTDFVLIDGRALTKPHKEEVKKFINECLDSCQSERTITVGL